MDASLLGLIVVLLALAVAVVIVARRLHQPPLIGYLALGVVLGPYALAVAPDTELVRWLAEVGVVFLMFSIGVEFSLSKLRSMRKLVLGLGSLQMLVVSALLALGLGAVGPWLGLPWQGALILGLVLALSSTAMVMRLAIDRGELETPHGRAVVGVLLFQDLALVPLLVAVPLLAASAGRGASGPEFSLPVVLALAGAVGVVVVVTLLGQRLVTPWLHLVARQKSQELFSLNVLLMTLGLAWVTEHLGLSLALGAFVAGMLISETEYRYQVEADIRPYRDILLGLFFLTVGMRLNGAVVLEQPVLLLGILAAMLAIKALAIAGLARLMGLPPGPALKSGLWLCQAGEFGFVLLEPQLIQGAIPESLLQPVLAAMVLSMVVTPWVIQRSDSLVLRFARSEFLRRSLEIHRIAAKAVAANQHLVICGFGRCGQNLAQLLHREGLSYVALDLDPQRIREAAAAGHSVVFGDASRREALVAAGVHRAAALVITYADTNAALQVISTVRQVAPALPILVRTLDEPDIARLMEAGATEVVPEVVEGSLMLASHALALAGVPLHRVVRRVREVRETRYSLFRGYIHGADDEHLERGAANPVVLRTLVVQPGSAWVGRPLSELHLDALGVDVAGMRRAGRRLEPAATVQIAAEDAIVLRGPADLLQEAEGILSGKPLHSAS